MAKFTLCIAMSAKGQVSVPFAYDPAAPAPTKWLAFLGALWPDEPDAINVVGEWYGYVISGRETSLPRFLCAGKTSRDIEAY
jgi:putative DNA primase/helicase